MTIVRFLCLIFISRFHSFTDKIASHVAVKWLNTGNNEYQKKASAGVRFEPTNFNNKWFDKRYMSKTYNIQARI